MLPEPFIAVRRTTSCRQVPNWCERCRMRHAKIRLVHRPLLVRAGGTKRLHKRTKRLFCERCSRPFPIASHAAENRIRPAESWWGGEE